MEPTPQPGSTPKARPVSIQNESTRAHRGTTMVWGPTAAGIETADLLRLLVPLGRAGRDKDSECKQETGRKLRMPNKPTDATTTKADF